MDKLVYEGALEARHYAFTAKITLHYTTLKLIIQCRTLHQGEQYMSIIFCTLNAFEAYVTARGVLRR